MADETVDEPANRTREAQGRVHHGEADAFLINIRHGNVVKMFISDHHVTAPVMAGFIREAALQYQRHFGAFMRMLRQLAAGADRRGDCIRHL